MRALYSAAATGMAAQELNVQVISNNIANLRTTGYKRQQVHFQDLLYQNIRRAGSSTSEQNTQLPAGLALGSGVKTTSTARVMARRRLSQPTEKDTTSRSAARGFFRVTLPDGRTAYSRDGSFDLSASGQLVTRDGYLVDPGDHGAEHRDLGDESAPPAPCRRPCRARPRRRRWGSSSCRASSTTRSASNSIPRQPVRRDLPPPAPRSGRLPAREGFGNLQHELSRRGERQRPSPRSRR